MTNYAEHRQGGGAGGRGRALARPSVLFVALAILGTAYWSGHAAEIARRTAHAIVTMTLIDALEWTGSLLGLCGAYLLATHSRVSRYGWLFFFSANVAMILFAYAIDRYGLLTQQVGFMGTSLLGLKRAGLLPYCGYSRNSKTVE